MRVAAIFPVGTSVGGASAAIKEILRREPVIKVHLIHGQAGTPGTPDPKEFAEQIRGEVIDPRVSWGPLQMVHSFNLTVAYSEIRRFIGEIETAEYERVYIGATGGTNPMVASLFQVATAYLRAEVVPIYVQKYKDQPEETLVGEAIRDGIIAEEALTIARSGQIRVGARVAQRLPSVDRWKFLRESLNALSYWDDFDYGQASQTLEHQARKSAEYAGHRLLGPTAETVGRISAKALGMNEFTKQIRDQQNFNAVATAADWTERVESGTLLVADALANANRRIVEGRYTDSVLRSYRAAECATQMRLLKLGIHPARPAAYRTAYERYAAPAGFDDKPLAFDKGLKLLGCTGALNLKAIESSVRALQNARNNTYLEHGYVRTSPEQAERCFDWSLEICQVLLGPAIEEKWREFTLQF